MHACLQIHQRWGSLEKCTPRSRSPNQHVSPSFKKCWYFYYQPILEKPKQLIRQAHALSDTQWRSCSAIRQKVDPHLFNHSLSSILWSSTKKTVRMHQSLWARCYCHNDPMTCLTTAITTQLPIQSMQWFVHYHEDEITKHERRADNSLDYYCRQVRMLPSKLTVEWSASMGDVYGYRNNQLMTMRSL